MVLLIIARQIDLSVASILALYPQEWGERILALRPLGKRHLRRQALFLVTPSSRSRGEGKDEGLRHG
jgi:hypothetical protein